MASGNGDATDVATHLTRRTTKGAADMATENTNLHHTPPAPVAPPAAVRGGWAGLTGSRAGLMAVAAAAIGVGFMGACASTGAGGSNANGTGLRVEAEPIARETAAADADPPGDTGSTGERDPGVLAYSARSIDGVPIDLSSYLGRVVLVVNTASECGFTPQYDGLQALYEEKRDDGFVVLGFPANDFMGQEPGSNAEIAAFCERNFGVAFPMFAKVSVKGERCHPLFARLAAESEEPSWNFTKYLIGRDGELVARFGPRTEPGDKSLRSAIERELRTTG
jgi:glutathione peroxidase